MWLCNSSIGRKVVMSVTGVALILFLTFHMSMNVVALFSGDAYNAVCEFLGANWYALVATLALAALAVIHIVYAFLLTMQNRRARGDERYAVTTRPAKVEWASQNMLVLGIIVLLGLLLHLFNFWYNMMFAELTHIAVPHLPSDGFAYILDTFSCPVYVVLYIIWLVAIWFHLSHGGAPCRLSAGTARCGSTVGRSSASSTPRCSCWASSSSCWPSPSDLRRACGNSNS